MGDDEADMALAGLPLVIVEPRLREGLSTHDPDAAVARFLQDYEARSLVPDERARSWMPGAGEARLLEAEVHEAGARRHLVGLIDPVRARFVVFEDPGVG